MVDLSDRSEWDPELVPLRLTEEGRLWLEVEKSPDLRGVFLVCLPIGPCYYSLNLVYRSKVGFLAGSAPSATCE